MMGQINLVVNICVSFPGGGRRKKNENQRGNARTTEIMLLSHNVAHNSALQLDLFNKGNKLTLRYCSFKASGMED